MVGAESRIAGPRWLSRWTRLLRGLALSCHPLPTLAVTAISAGLAALAGTGLGAGVLVTLAVFTGQLSIGWSNDRLDAARDRSVHRLDKPAATGAVALKALTAATSVALLATIALSLSLGYRAGLVALLTVAAGWAYNLGLKTTVLSWLPFALAFGLLPAIATLARADPRWPAPWAVAAGALLGVAAHFANVLPDLRADEDTGVRGLPHRLGTPVSVVLGPVVLLGASAAIVLGAATRLGGWRWLIFAGCVMAAATAATIGMLRPANRVFFVGTVLVAMVDLALFGFSGARLVQ